jgi:type II secretory pathway pseudopilin PulG
MKIFPHDVRKDRRPGSAFTLPEVMISVSVLLVVLASVLTGHLFGLRLFQITKAKLGANQDSRMAISKLTDEIREAKWIQVGTGSQNSFTEVDDGDPQQGNAIQIYSTATNTPYIRYYMDTGDGELKRVTSTITTPEVIAHSISNTVVFASENSQGAVLTDNENNRVIGLLLSFYQIQYPIIKVGPGEYYDYYQLRTRITRRSLE